MQKCFYCGSLSTVKNGLKHGSQCYKCKACGRQYIGRCRRDKSQVITDHIEGKQTQEQTINQVRRIRADNRPRHGMDAVCSKDIRTQACYHPDGHDL